MVVDQAEALKKAHQFADLAYSVEMGKAAREFSTKLQTIQAEFGRRGIAQTGKMTGETARLRGEQATTLVTKRLDLLLEGYELHGVEITDDVADETLADVMEVRRKLIASAASAGARVGASSLPMGSGPELAALVENRITVTPASIKTEIDRRRLMRKRAEPTQTNVYHVYGHQPRWGQWHRQPR